LQQSVLALELLDKFFLPRDQECQALDRSFLLRIRRCGLPQSIKCIVERSYLAH
jgi:hypothetical protein